jgi:hypothetical protein
MRRQRRRRCGGNPVENIWQYLRANFLSNRVFETYDEVFEAAFDAWQKLIAKPETISSIRMRQWAHEVRPNDRWYE